MEVGLLFHEIPLQERAGHWHSTAVASFLWGSEVWDPSSRAHEVIRSAEARRLRRTTLVSHVEDGGWIQHRRRRPGQGRFVSAAMAGTVSIGIGRALPSVLVGPQC